MTLLSLLQYGKGGNVCQGEMNGITKLDRHYHGLFSFLAIKDDDIWQVSPSESSRRRSDLYGFPVIIMPSISDDMYGHGY